MINYTIEQVNPLNNDMLIRYHKDGREDWWRRIALPAEYDDESLRQIAEEQAPSAAAFWDRTDGLPSSYELENNSGSVKDVVVAEQPDYDPMFQRVEVVETEDSTTKYINYTVHELDANAKSGAIRHKRNQLLVETDTLALADRNMSDEMTTYRQALRDITSQESFPESVIWPIKPL